MGNYSAIKYRTSQNGPGIRTSIFLSGCNLHCKGCFNSGAWDFCSGNELTSQVIDDVVKSLDFKFVRGLSILGGEPMDPKNQDSTLKLIKAVKKHFSNKDVWLWTGYVVGKSLPMTEHTKEILQLVDTVVDGPFMNEKRDLTLQYAGSTNQRVLDKEFLQIYANELI